MLRVNRDNTEGIAATLVDRVFGITLRVGLLIECHVPFAKIGSGFSRFIGIAESA